MKKYNENKKAEHLISPLCFYTLVLLGLDLFNRPHLAHPGQAA
jgi:hypothetical protein